MKEYFLCFSLMVLLMACNSGSSSKDSGKSEEPKQEEKVEKKEVPENERDKSEIEKKEEATKPGNEVEKRPSSTASVLLSGSRKSEMLKRINAVRKSGCKCGNRSYPPLPALTWSDALGRIAATHSIDMASGLGMSHKGSDGRDVDQRLDKFGYEWRAYAENVAFGHLSIEEVVKGWLKSVPHCENIMNSRVTEIGAAEKDKYWTLLFAAPQDLSI